MNIRIGKPFEKVVIHKYCKENVKAKTNVYSVVNGDKFLIDTQIKLSNFTNYTVTYNGLKTTVVLEDGSKGVAKCKPEDLYNQQIGHDIAVNRARVKSLESSIKKTIGSTVSNKKYILEGQIKEMENKLADMKKEVNTL